MKQIFTLLLLALIVQVGFAQEEKPVRPAGETEKKDDMKTIFTKDNLKLTGGYIAPEIKVGDVHEDISLFVGGRMGFTFNDKFSMGLAGYGLVSNSNFDINRTGTPESVSIGFGYGGLNMEYTLFSNKVVHFTIPVVVGVGGVYLYEDQGDYLYDNFYDIENSAAFVVEPGVTVELNLFKFFRIDLGASYRYVAGTELVYLQDSDLSDLSFNATFKFGFF